MAHEAFKEKYLAGELRPFYEEETGLDRIELTLEQHGFCAFCGEGLDPQATDENKPTVEHINPRNNGGPDAVQNMAMVHLRCNLADRYEAGLAARLRAMGVFFTRHVHREFGLSTFHVKGSNRHLLAFPHIPEDNPGLAVRKIDNICILGRNFKRCGIHFDLLYTRDDTASCLKGIADEVRGASGASGILIPGPPNVIRYAREPDCLMELGMERKQHEPSPGADFFALVEQLGLVRPIASFRDAVHVLNARGVVHSTMKLTSGGKEFNILHIDGFPALIHADKDHYDSHDKESVLQQAKYLFDKLPAFISSPVRFSRIIRSIMDGNSSARIYSD